MKRNRASYKITVAVFGVTCIYQSDLSDAIQNNTEPGKYGNSYVKSGNGEISPSGINSADANDEELTPLSKILDDLAPITKIPMDELTPLNPNFLKNQRSLDAADFKKIRNPELTRQLLGEMMKTKCPGELPVKKRKVKFVVGTRKT